MSDRLRTAGVGLYLVHGWMVGVLCTQGAEMSRWMKARPDIELKICRAARQSSRLSVLAYIMWDRKIAVCLCLLCHRIGERFSLGLGL